MNIEEIRMQLDHLTCLPRTLDKIHSQGFYNLFFTSFQSLHSLNKSFKTQEFKKCLKIIVTELIDNVWESEGKDLGKVSPEVSDRRKNCVTPNMGLKKSVNSCVNLKSNLKGIGPGSFVKEKKSFQKEGVGAQGAGSFEVVQKSSKSKSPSSVISKEKRGWDLAHKDSPAKNPSLVNQPKYSINHKENC